MWLKLSTLFLLPVLFIQGHKVRKNTPRLAEAKGEREGRAGQGKSLSLLILGDSAAAGVGVENQKDALSGAIIQELQNEFSLQWKLHAKTGDTTRQVFNALQHLEEQKYDVIVTSIGVNDVTKLTSAKSWIKQQKQLFEHIQKRFQPKLIIISVCLQCNISGFTESTSLVVWAICRANESKITTMVSTTKPF